MEKIEILDYCWCDNPLPKFTAESQDEIIIHRYVGGKGHLVDVGYHPKCYEHWRTMGGILDAILPVEKENGKTL